MYSPAVVARAEAAINRQLGPGLDFKKLVRHSHEECWALREQLSDVIDEKGNQRRPLTAYESAFIQSEKLLHRIDFRYAAERYYIIAKETQEAAPLFPLWASQELFLQRLAALEDARLATGHPDGILVNCLKARQLGISTLSQALLAHRATTQRSLRCLVAADVREQSEYMFSMAEQIIEHLPWWLQVEVTAHRTGTFWAAGTGTSIRVAWGHSSRGGLQDQAKVKGNIGRGKTYGVVHLSELSTWEKPAQIEDALMPGVPRRSRTFMCRESTAKGRHDYWHSEWGKADKGVGRFTNIFIPWYIEPDKYWAPPPEGWAPDDGTKAHAEAVERDSPRWCLGKTYRLTREQLYWYETTKAAFIESDELYKFYEEYPATPEESFQHSGRSIFKSSTLELLKRQERSPVGICYVQPASDIAQLRAWEREQVKLDA